MFSRKPAAAASPSSAPVSSAAAAPASSVAIGPPQLLASDPAYAEAISHLNNALRLEDSGGQVNAALAEYDIGLQMMLGLLKRLPRESPDQSAEKARDLLRSLIDRYMTRAEQLKQKKIARENGSSGNGVVQHPAMMRARSNPQNPAVPSASARAASSAASSASSSASPPSTVATTAKSNIDPALRTAIEGEILVASSGGVTFSHIIGMEDVKQALKEMVILPSLRPDLFSGIRAPPKGLLLYGPPGNGKSFVAAAVAAESHATFFSISAATLVSKHLGEGERLVRALFAVARERAPSIIFVDEIDSIMSRRSSEEHEASRRLKTEFFIQFDGAADNITSGGAGAPPPGRIIVLAATNCPELLDEALIRRLSRRIYIPVPSTSARTALLSSMMSRDPNLRFQLTPAQISKLVADTEGYSNSDLKALVGDAALGPLRALSPDQLLNTPADQLPPVRSEHFNQALAKIRPSVSKERLLEYEAWSKKQDGAR